MYKLTIILVSIILLPFFTIAQNVKVEEGIFNDEGIEIANTDVVYIEYYAIEYKMDLESDSLYISLYGIDERMTPVYYHIKEYISISKDKIVVLCNSQNTIVKDVDILVTYNMKEKSIYIRSFTHYLKFQGNIRNTGIYQKIKQKE